MPRSAPLSALRFSRRRKRDFPAQRRSHALFTRSVPGKAYPAIKSPEEKAAATAVLSVLAAAPAELSQGRLAATDLPQPPPNASKRSRTNSTSACQEEPRGRGENRVSCRRADAALVETKQQPIPKTVLPADLVATFLRVHGVGKTETDAPAAPIGAGPAIDAGTILDPASRPHISFGAASLPVLAMPTIGDDIAGLWTAAHDQSRSAVIA